MPRWMLLLGSVLLVWEPLRASLAAAQAIPALPVRGPMVLFVLLLRAAVAATSLAAGIAVCNRRPHARFLSLTTFGMAAAVDLFVYLTPFFPNNRVPGDTKYYIAASLAYNGAWITWLLAVARRAWP